MSIAEKTEDSKAKRMLLKLQQRSWEMELLFSGFAIYGLVELRSYLQIEGVRNAYYEFGETDYLEIIIPIAKSLSYEFITEGLLYFIILLFAHIFLRGFWIALIGLRNASGELDPTTFRIRRLLKKGKSYGEINFDNYASKVEKLASATFGLAFLSFFILVAFLFYIVCLGALFGLFLPAFSLLGQRIAYSGLVQIILILPLLLLTVVVLFHLFAGAVAVIDFILQGRLRKIQKRFFHVPIHLCIGYVGIVTLSFLWRPFLVNYWNSRLTSRLFYLFIAFFLILNFSEEFNYSGDSYHPQDITADDSFSAAEINTSGIQSRNIYMSEFYFDEIEANSLYPISYIIIPAKRMYGKLFEVFIQNELYEGTLRNWPDSLQPLRSSRLTFMESDYFYNRSETEHVLKTKQTLKSSFEFGIDENTVLAKNSSVDFYTHPSINREGVLCFFPLSDSLTIGKHYFKLTFRRLDEKGKTKSVVYEIPFIYEGQ